MFNDSEFISSSGASHVLRCSSETVRQLAKRGALPAVRTPIGFLFDRATVERLAEQRRSQAED